MRPTRIALIGALALCVQLSLTSCASSGATHTAVLTETELLEVPTRQLIEPSPELLVVPELGPAPTPAINSSPGCTTGCYSSQQLEEMLSRALQWGRGLAEQIWAIGTEVETAKATNPPTR